MIRPAMPSDISKILMLAEIMHAESKFSHLSFDKNKFGNFLLDLMKNRCFIGYVDEKNNNKIVGVVLSYICEYFFNSDIMIQGCGFYVIPEYRKDKTGSKLLRKLVDIGEKIGAKEICLLPVESDDKEYNALDSLYRKCGFSHEYDSFYKIKFNQKQEAKKCAEAVVSNLISVHKLKKAKFDVDKIIHDPA